MTSRTICQFSCGAASAVATKIIATQQPDALIVRAYVAREHADANRFAADCEQWFGRPITTLRDEKYDADPINVFRRRGWIKGSRGTSCSAVLKRELLRSIEQPGDVLVLGYTIEEEERLHDWRQRWGDSRPIVAPLIDAGLTKEDCKAMVERAGIRLPAMYVLGYDNANCKACPQGGQGYFRAIRHDFPEDFNELAAVEAAIGPGAFILFHRSGPKKGERFPLTELSDGPIVRNEAMPSCSFFCEMAESSYAA